MVVYHTISAVWCLDVNVGVLKSDELGAMWKIIYQPLQGLGNPQSRSYDCWSSHPHGAAEVFFVAYHCVY